YVLFDLCIRIAELRIHRIHLDLDDTLCIRRQVRGYVLERHKGRRRHEELAEDQRRSAGLPHLPHCRLLSSGAGIVSIWDLLDGFEDAIAFRKVPSSRAACREAFGYHLPGLHPTEEIEEVIGVTSHESASEPDQFSRAAIEDSEVVALRSLLCQLVQFIG